MQTCLERWAGGRPKTFEIKGDNSLIGLTLVLEVAKK
jgi:hypothetical protein